MLVVTLAELRVAPSHTAAKRPLSICMAFFQQCPAIPRPWPAMHVCWCNLCAVRDYPISIIAPCWPAHRSWSSRQAHLQTLRPLQPQELRKNSTRASIRLRGGNNAMQIASCWRHGSQDQRKMLDLREETAQTCGAGQERSYRKPF